MESANDPIGPSEENERMKLSKPEKMKGKLFDDNYDSDKYRMWAAVSFAVMLLVVGVPLWWKTTEVERSSLPYNEIAKLDPSSLTISTTLLISTEYPSFYNSIRTSFLHHFKLNPSVLKVDISSVKLDKLLSQSQNVSLESIEDAASARRIATEPGSLLLVQLPESNQLDKILVSAHRIIYFTDKAGVEELIDTVMNWMMEESELLSKMSSMLDPQAAVLSDSVSSTTRLKAATSYDFVFSIVNSDPSRMNLSFDIKHLIQRYVEPLLDQVKEAGVHRARSQWIHLLDLSTLSTSTQDGSVNVIELESLPHIITPLEKRIGSGVCGVAGCVQLVLYVTPCGSNPLVFGSSGSLSMTAPPWGSVQIVNPDNISCMNSSSFSPKPTPIMATFVSQIHSLLGFTNPPERLASMVSLRRKVGPELRDWQLDALFRMRALEQLVSASLTLKSLAKLLGEISNIVINTEVARCVEISVASVEEGLTQLRKGRLVKALRSSQQAFIHAEKAFTDPSLLALLYFPDDQKYAVYIPLFLPIMIPVFMSLKPIYKWLVGSKASS